MKQFTWDDVLATEFCGYSNVQFLLGEHDAQKRLESFKEKVLARTEPPKEGDTLFEMAADLAREAGKNLQHFPKQHTEYHTLKDLPPNILSDYITDMDEPENEILFDIVGGIKG